MKLVRIYQCLCDETRLRILHLLSRRPLCVWQIQELLREPQVKVSRHLAYLRRRGMVATRRQGNEMLYRLPDRRSPELERHLKCLQDCTPENATLKSDQRRLVRFESISREVLK